MVAARFCGPPRSGNGGYLSGLLAGTYADPAAQDRSGTAGATDPADAVEVSLRQPPPLDSAMLLREEPEDGVRTLTFGGAVIATARPVLADIDPVEPCSYDEAVAASASYPGLVKHPFPTCFACGTERLDGLRIFPGLIDRVDGRARVAATWTPDESVAADFHTYSDPALRAALPVTWAAIDCVGGWAGDFGDRLMVLARMTAVVDDLPLVGEPHLVMAEGLGSQGRKTFSAATLYDADGRIVARAEHLWVSVDPDTFNAPASS